MSFLNVDGVWFLEHVGAHNTDEFLRIVDQAENGYGLGKHLDDRGMFFSLGFHIGSERLADVEFKNIDAFLKNKFPELVSDLVSTQTD